MPAPLPAPLALSWFVARGAAALPWRVNICTPQRLHHCALPPRCLCCRCAAHYRLLQRGVAFKTCAPRLPSRTTLLTLLRAGTCTSAFASDNRYLARVRCTHSAHAPVLCRFGNAATAFLTPTGLFWVTFPYATDTAAVRNHTAHLSIPPPSFCAAPPPALRASFHHAFLHTQRVAYAPPPCPHLRRAARLFCAHCAAVPQRHALPHHFCHTCLDVTTAHSRYAMRARAARAPATCYSACYLHGAKRRLPAGSSLALCRCAPTCILGTRHWASSPTGSPPA